MMVPKKSLVLAGAALALFGAAANAQTRVFKQVNKPFKAHTINLSTGTVTRGMNPANRAVGSAIFIQSDFFNFDLGNSIGIDTSGCEWMDAGVKGQQLNQSDLFSSMVFAYCSSKLTTNSGGPGSSIRLGFYEGYTQGGGAATTTILQISLTGLPGNSANSSPIFGGCTPIGVRVFPGGLTAFADVQIGYSWRFDDSGTGTINPLGAINTGTAAWLACVTSCSATSNTQLDALAMDNRIDEYCPAGTLLTTFSFGTTPLSPPFPFWVGSLTSVNMSIEELDDITLATIINSNSGTQPNPDILTSVPCIIARPWTASLKLGLARNKASSWILYFGSGLVNPPNGTPLAQFTGGFNFGASKAGRMLLTAIDTLGTSISTSHGATLGNITTTAAATIPVDFTLVCAEWSGQAVILGRVAGDTGNPSARMSSLIRGVVGTHD